MRRIFISVVMIALLALGGMVQAVNIETVFVGDKGNAADTTGYGSVAYNYNIGKYEVTAGQYTEFLNAKAKTDPYKLYDTQMANITDYYMGCNIQRSGAGTSANPYSYSIASDWANRPVNYVTYWSSLRFTNWLCNGQDDGSTETGAYTLDGYKGRDGRSITRNAGWTWALTSEDEWYKAAYYDPDKTGNTQYWKYTTMSDINPDNKVLAIDPGNSINQWKDYVGYSIGQPYWRTDVGEFENSASAYGTFDQGGNVFEWNESFGPISSTSAFRMRRGGSFNDLNRYWSGSSTRQYDSPDMLREKLGFRVVQAYVPQAVPEPVTLLGFGLPMLMLGLGKLRGLRK
jgi:formylglycine-generating enzyme required for sulfatase activity